ncbi:hypothetical protein ACAX43_12370 [Paraburkholderia sp. IW21]|uniref:hypothetical protein n=1 Tax=Paraburkholderia sp. IW21 TaxID=3242488 RepID=UPI003520B6EA
MEPVDKVLNPLSWVTGGKFAKWENEDIPRFANTALAPITQGLGKIDEAINPLRKIPLFDRIGKVAEAKPADTIGLVVGSIFSGGALDGALAGSGGAAGAGAGAAGVGAADAGTAAAVGAGAADVGTAAGLGSGLLAGTAGTDLGGGALAATMGTTAGATGSIGAAGGFGAGAAGLGAGATSVGMTGVGNGIGASIGAGAGQAGTGFYGAMNGAAAYGDSGLLGSVGTGGASTFSMPTAYGSALGEAPTGLYSGLLPGGGMTGTSSGALGGGMSGMAYGEAPVGFGTGATTSMGGFANSPMLSNGLRAVNLGSKAYNVANSMNQPQQQAPVITARAPRSGRGVANAMPSPAPLPMMSNPAASMVAMPSMGTAPLPTTTSSYQALLGNMLANSQNPMANLGNGSNFMPGAGTSMNPAAIIPGMY